MLIIFDLDDTLIDTWNFLMPIKFRVAIKVMVEAGLIIKSEEDTFKRLMEINNVADNGKEAFETLFKELEINDTNLLNLVLQTYFGGPELEGKVPLLEGAQEVLQGLKSEHKLAIVSQGDERVQFGKIERACIDKEIFTQIIITPEYDKTKSYRELSTSLGFVGKEVLVCGDKFKTDLLPAKNLSMYTAHMKWGRGKIKIPRDNEVDYIISSLKELIPIIEGLK